MSPIVNNVKGCPIDTFVFFFLVLRLMPIFYFLCLCIFSSGFIVSIAKAEHSYIVEHVDVIYIDPQLTLSELVLQTLEQYPDYALIAAMHQESAALNERGSRWVAGALNAYVYYKDDFAGTESGAYEIDGAVSVPVWNWGQRDAGLKLAEYSEQKIVYKVNAIKLKVAGLVRAAVWSLKHQELRYQMAQKAYQLTEQLVKTVQRRVELGDLPRTDFLLVQSELLEQKTELIETEAQLMHVRKEFYFLTQNNKIPADFKEIQSSKDQIDSTHPHLASIAAEIAQKKAQIEWIKAQGSGQTTLAIGGDTEKPSSNDRVVNSITFNVSVPFGGSAYLAPKVAKTNTAYVKAEVKRAHLYRKLKAQVHEALHELEIEREQLKVAQEMQLNAQEHLKMANLSFEAGEMNLMDFIKIQSRSLKAIRYAQESAIKLQRNIAFYNQAVGVMP